MDTKPDALEEFMTELGSVMAEIAEALQAKTKSADEISASLSDLVGAIEKNNKGASLADVTGAIKSIRIESPVTVHVNPTPIQNIVQPAPVQILERARCAYTFSFEYDNFDRITKSTATPIEPKSSKT